MSVIFPSIDADVEKRCNITPIPHPFELLASYFYSFFITGLNPFKSLEGHFNSLTTDDANYVEVIHTETTTNGVLNAIGDVDFYPFGGNEQAGCTDAEDLGACSHNRAWELFAASLTHGRIIGYRCVNQDGATSDTPCTGFTLPLGTNDFIKYG